MPGPISTRRTVRFGPYELDLRSRELRKAGRRLRVPEQSIQVLETLLEAPGELVTREQLRDRLWPDHANTFVDYEQGLNAAVRRLREALGDSADAPRYVETLPRRGYRFTGTVEDSSSEQTRSPTAAPAAATGTERPRRTKQRGVRAMAAVVLGAALAVGGWQWTRQSRLAWAREEAPAEVARLLEAQDFYDAFRIAQSAHAVDPSSPRLQQLLANTSRPTTVTSTPAGALVEVRGYRTTREGWTVLGRTPLRDVRVPGGLVRVRLTHPGFDPLEAATHWGPPWHFELVAAGSTPRGMVRVPAGTANMPDVPAVKVNAFWIDRLEVTNREFKQFVDAGGYRDRKYWSESFVVEGRLVPWEQAIARFVDTTGRPGPATWELGSYQEGRANHPVSGVSWYEASAYLAYAGKSLPTTAHWRRAAGLHLLFGDVITESNFSRAGPAPSGRHAGLGPFGTLDMAGNVKEWCWNESGGRRLILGGDWNDEPYMFFVSDAHPPMERHAGFGFRGMRESDPPQAELRQPVAAAAAPVPTPAGDETFDAYRRLFDYDRVPLRLRVDAVDDTHQHWRRETISFEGPDADERIPALLFLPRGARPPFQVVIYCPGSEALILRSRRDLALPWIEALVRSGRAVLHPIYKGTFDRGVAPALVGPNTARDVTVIAGREIRRALDAVELRDDLDASRVALVGLSHGAVQGVVAAAVEPRLKTAVLLGGGLPRGAVPPELNPVHYAPRVRIPVLMVNGQWDFLAPYDTSQKPLFDLLGSGAGDKRHRVFPGGHAPVRRHDMVAEVLAWLDSRLGVVTQSPP